MSAGTAIQTMVTEGDIRLVRKTARKVCYQFYGGSEPAQEEELYHFGVVGLIEAKRKFAQDKGIPFQAFAVHRIKGAMIDYLRTSPVVRLPQKKQNMIRDLEQAKAELAQNGKRTDDVALAKKLVWAVEQVREVAAMKAKVVSISRGKSEGGNTDEPQDIDVPASGAGPELQSMKKELGQVVQKCLEGIKDARDRFILVSRVFEERKLKELAAGLGCSIEMVRLRQLKALESMKRCLSSHGWDEDSVPEVVG